MSKEELLKQLDQEFEKIKKELKFTITLDELDNIFFIRDYILQVNFVSKKFSRMLCGRIRDTFSSWIGQLHGWLMPNPSSMIGISESGIFDEQEKEEIIWIMKIFMKFISQNVLIGLTKDQKKEAEYINNSLIVWNKNIDSLIKFSKKIQSHWNKEVLESEEKLNPKKG